VPWLAKPRQVLRGGRELFRQMPGYKAGMPGKNVKRRTSK
jgi:hypothetical protein